MKQEKKKKAIISEAGMELTDDELDGVAGGISVGLDPNDPLRWKK